MVEMISTPGKFDNFHVNAIISQSSCNNIFLIHSIRADKFNFDKELPVLQIIAISVFGKIISKDTQEVIEAIKMLSFLLM